MGQLRRRVAGRGLHPARQMEHLRPHRGYRRQQRPRRGNRADGARRLHDVANHHTRQPRRRRRAHHQEHARLGADRQRCEQGTHRYLQHSGCATPRRFTATRRKSSSTVATTTSSTSTSRATGWPMSTSASAYSDGASAFSSKTSDGGVRPMVHHTKNVKQSGSGCNSAA